MTRKYNTTDALVYRTAQLIPVVKRCNGFVVTNVGDTIAEVNGMVLFPSATPLTALGDSRSVGGNEGEVYTGKLQLAFRQPVGAAPGVEIIQKFYTDNE